MNATYPIENVPLFTNLPPSQLEPLKKSAVRLLYQPGESVFQQGDLPEYLYIVEEGEVDIVLPAQGEELIVASFQSGSFFGELAVFDNQPRSAAARRFLSVVIQRLRGADELMSRLHIKNVNDMVDQRMTVGERVADLVARFGGSWTFIICFGVFLLLWAAVNSALILARPPDPYPYIFLNLILSCIAALQAPVIMMSQNRLAAKDRLQADQDFQINIKAEFAVQQLHRKLDELRASLMQRRHAAPDQQR